MQGWIDTLNFYGKARIPCAFFIDFLGEKGEVFPLNSLKDENVLMSFPSFNNIDNQHIGVDPVLKADYPSLENYRNAFDTVQYHLNRGDTYLTNLTFSTPITLNLDLNELFSQVHAKYRIKFKDEWLCFSPETFIEIKNNRISTFPMKGTIDAHLPNAAEQLLNNTKEIAEHHTIVDLLRNDLSQVAKKVKVEKLMYLEEIKTQKGTILQMSSEITGQMPSNWQDNLGDLLKKMLPAGSVSGAPKNKTLEIIKDVELHDRDYYTGIAGIFDGEYLDSCVLIRFIHNTRNTFFYKSGGGITALSSMEDEYAELKQKIYVPIY